MFPNNECINQNTQTQWETKERKQKQQEDFAGFRENNMDSRRQFPYKEYSGACQKF